MSYEKFNKRNDFKFLMNFLQKMKTKWENLAFLSCCLSTQKVCIRQGIRGGFGSDMNLCVLCLKKFLMWNEISSQYFSLEIVNLFQKKPRNNWERTYNQPLANDTSLSLGTTFAFMMMCRVERENEKETESRKIIFKVIHTAEETFQHVCRSIIATAFLLITN